MEVVAGVRSSCSASGATASGDEAIPEGLEVGEETIQE